MTNSLITKPLHYSQEDIKGLYEIFIDEEKLLKEKNPFVALFEEKGFYHDVFKDFLFAMKNHDISIQGKEFNYEDLFIVDHIADTTIQFSKELYELLFLVDRKELPKYLTDEHLRKFAHWRILTKK